MILLPVFAFASWEDTLKAVFPGAKMVETFDNLQDWSIAGRFYSMAPTSPTSIAVSPDYLPKYIDGTQSKWTVWNTKGIAFKYTPGSGSFAVGDIVTGSPSGATATVKGVWHLADGDYLQITLNGGTSGTTGLTAGDSISASGGKTGTNLQWPKIIADHGPDKVFRGVGKSLMFAIGDNQAGTAANPPPMEGIGTQRLGTFFGDPAGLTGKYGYKKIHVFFMIKFAPGSFPRDALGNFSSQGLGVFKVFDTCSGFTTPYFWGTAAENALADTPVLAEYGLNFDVWNIGGGGISRPTQVYWSENTHVSEPPPGAGYYKIVSGREIRYDSVTGSDLFLTSFAGYGFDQWMGVEVVSDIGTMGNANATTDVYLYNSDGTLVRHYENIGEEKLRYFDHLYNKVTFGGNKLLFGGMVNGLDSRHWIDDVIISDSRIGPTYFDTLNGVITNPEPAGVKVLVDDSWKIAPLKVYLSGSWKLPTVKVYIDGVWEILQQGQIASLYALPVSRVVPWQDNAGVEGDIPTDRTIYTTLSPSGSAATDTAAIQNALNNAASSGKVVKLNAGTFFINATINMPSYRTLRGSGMGITTLRGTTAISDHFIGTVWQGQPTTTRNMSGIMTKGTYTINIPSGHGFVAGDIILIDQLNNATGDPVVSNVGSGTCTWCGRTSGTRSLGQLAEVASVTTTTATLKQPLYWDYSLSLTPQALKVGSLTRNFGIEDMTIDNITSANSTQNNRGTVMLSNTVNCWVLNTEVIGSYQTNIRVYRTFRNTIRGCKLHGEAPVDGSELGSGRGYAMWLNPAASANLIEYNVIYQQTSSFLINGAVSGNVISYNYIVDLNGDPQNYNSSIVCSHGSHPIMNLFEGNYSEGTHLADNVWGSSSHNVFFRNRHQIRSNSTNRLWDVDIQKNQTYYSLLGNVFGGGGETYYELVNMDISGLNGQRAIYRLGYTGISDYSASGNDAKVASTVLRHGNWDIVTNGAVWNGSDNRSLPASLYLISKPSWMKAGTPWPPVGPDVSPRYPTKPITYVNPY